jgi:hypothetical protein
VDKGQHQTVASQHALRLRTQGKEVKHPDRRLAYAVCAPSRMLRFTSCSQVIAHRPLEPS